MNKKKNILIAGPILPPAGGISIHLQRLQQLLEDEFEFTFIDEASTIKKSVFNIRSLNLIRYFKLIIDADLFFIHSGNKYFKKLHIICGKLFRKKIIITLHGYGNERNYFLKKIDSFYFNLADKIVLVNHQITYKLLLKNSKCIVKHAFLPPAMNMEAALPESISKKINTARSSKSTIICANASKLITFDNQDLYGLDMCLELSKSLSANHYPHFFVFVVTSLSEGMERYENAVNQILKEKMEDHFMLLNKEISFVKLIEQADIVIRPTHTDGDALTIREGLFLQKTVLASDVVIRPEGTILFKNRDQSDLFEKVTSVILDKNMKNESQEKSITTGIQEEKIFYSNLFKSLMSNN